MVNGFSKMGMPGIGLQQPGMSAPKVESVQELVTLKPVKLGESPYKEVKKSYLTEDGTLMEITTTYAAACGTCRKLFTSDSDARNSSSCSCDTVICSVCAEDENKKCAKCGRTVCSECRDTNQRGQVVCKDCWLAYE